jgi:hypothetical protein
LIDTAEVRFDRTEGGLHEEEVVVVLTLLKQCQDGVKRTLTWPNQVHYYIIVSAEVILFIVGGWFNGRQW